MNVNNVDTLLEENQNLFNQSIKNIKHKMNKDM